MKGVFWILAFLCSLVLLAAAYYVTSSDVRGAINARMPWVEPLLRPYVRGSDESRGYTTRSAGHAPASAPASVAPTPAAPVAAEPEVIDIKKLAANRAAWPAKVTIRKPTYFPAVVNGKVVGGLTAPSGTEVGLVSITGEKLGVEYQGGGAWVLADETDVIERAQKK